MADSTFSVSQAALVPAVSPMAAAQEHESFPLLTVAPAQVVRGVGILAQQGAAIARLGQRPLVIAGDRAGQVAAPSLGIALEGLTMTQVTLGECSETSLTMARQQGADHGADLVIGVGGGKALDAAKLVAHQLGCPVVTVPTTAATCAAWTALSNVYSDQGAFLYDVPLPQCPDRLILDYDLIATAPTRTLIAGIGDALAKWYEASISSGSSDQTLIIAAVQQARVLRDLLLQQSAAALAQPGGPAWRAVVDATVLMAGVIGGLGGAQCRTVAAHAVHNGLTHLPASHGTLHGEKVAYGILVQLRLEEMTPNYPLAIAARQQILPFYDQIGLPKTLADLGLGDITLPELARAAAIACQAGSDIHHLPFTVTPEGVAAAMISTTTPLARPVSAPDARSQTWEDVARNT